MTGDTQYTNGEVRQLYFDGANVAHHDFIFAGNAKGSFMAGQYSITKLGSDISRVEERLRKHEEQLNERILYDQREAIRAVKASKRRSNAKRRELGHREIPQLPIGEGEVAHHISNDYIMGIPEEIHKSLSGYSREEHRKRVLMWIRDNDEEKWQIVRQILIQGIPEAKLEDLRRAEKRLFGE